MRISVSRADLARALTLPVKKEKAGEGSGELQQELFAADESVAALLDFMSSFMLFQFQDDTCILPSEVAAATQMVKEGQPQKVDWAGLMWGFVEKELLETRNRGKAKLEAVPENETSMEALHFKWIWSMEFENLSKVDAEGQEDGKFDGFFGKMDSLGRMNSTDLLQQWDSQCFFRIPENAHDPSSGEFLSIGPEAHKNPKRMRSNGVWEYSPLDFDACIEQVQSSLGKAKMFYAEKEQAYMNAQMELQYLNGILHQKDQFIHSLEKARMEEQQKWQMELCRFEHELNVMSQLVVGYKRALKQTRSAFSDYRKKFPQSEEPLYSDVPGSGGVVLSTKELERQRWRKRSKCGFVR
ncbi:hypothetical protein ACMD2_17598 [Ananas comosus]|uniref:Uncharacterized protein n=1 Tax=Ananas comosus TaxID=4615 RepID=A0A199VVK9_ANACO|nr:hypothetical protein ACMD2_17598 [Ananas comosus]